MSKLLSFGQAYKPLRPFADQEKMPTGTLQSYQELSDGQLGSVHASGVGSDMLGNGVQNRPFVPSFAPVGSVLALGAVIWKRPVLVM